MSKKVAIVVSKPPYGTAFMGEGFRAAMGLPAVGLETNVILEGDAVFALIKDADPKSSLDMDSLADAFSAFEDFGFNLYVHGPSVRVRNLNCGELIACQPLEDYEFKTMLRDQDIILRF